MAFFMNILWVLKSELGNSSVDRKLKGVLVRLGAKVDGSVLAYSSYVDNIVAYSWEAPSSIRIIELLRQFLSLNLGAFLRI